jgi:hypothetical protein
MVVTIDIKNIGSWYIHCLLDGTTIKITIVLLLHHHHHHKILVACCCKSDVFCCIFVYTM